MLKFERKVSGKVREWLGHAATDYFVITDSPTEMAEYAEKVFPQGFMYGHDDDFHGRDGIEGIRRKVRTGDKALVAPSDKFLAAMEDQVHPRTAWRTRDDVVGGGPNVPAYLSGSPM